MIKSLKIKNIQSHKDSEFHFNDGINCIVGSSNNGKSAILRALYWVVYNRPLGTDSLLSHWAINDKGNQSDEMSVTVDNGNIVTRRRFKNENQYIVNDKILNVVKSDVPDEVRTSLNLSDTNIQKQLDEPFLLSSTSGEVAKYFNSIVRLDIIDKILSNVESKRRKFKSEIESLHDKIIMQEKELGSYDWIDSANELIAEYDSVDGYANDCNSIVDDLVDSIDCYNSALSGIYDFSNENNILSECDKISNEMKNIAVEIGYIEKSLNDYAEFDCHIYDFSNENRLLERINRMNSIVDDANYIQLEKSIDSYNSLIDDSFDFSNELKLIDEIESVDLSLKNEIESLSSSITDYVCANNEKAFNDGEIERLKKSLPEICPLCGNKMEVHG